MPRPLRARLTAILLVTVLGCSEVPGLGLAPVTPKDWQTIVVLDVDGTATASIAVPMAFHPTDHPPAGTDNYADAITRDGLSLQFEGPHNPDSQLEPGEDLRAILERRLQFGGDGAATFADVDLPAGHGVRMDRTDQRGERMYRVVCYAISMPEGTAFLLFDGPPPTYAGHELELSQIARLVASR